MAVYVLGFESLIGLCMGVKALLENPVACRFVFVVRDCGGAVLKLPMSEMACCMTSSACEFLIGLYTRTLENLTA